MDARRSSYPTQEEEDRLLMEVDSAGDSDIEILPTPSPSPRPAFAEPGSGSTPRRGGLPDDFVRISSNGEEEESQDGLGDLQPGDFFDEVMATSSETESEEEESEEDEDEDVTENEAERREREMLEERLKNHPYFPLLKYKKLLQRLARADPDLLTAFVEVDRRLEETANDRFKYFIKRMNESREMTDQAVQVTPPSTSTTTQTEAPMSPAVASTSTQMAASLADDIRVTEEDFAALEEPEEDQHAVVEWAEMEASNRTPPPSIEVALDRRAPSSSRRHEHRQAPYHPADNHLGWYEIEGRWVEVLPRLPGCFNCSRASYHYSECPHPANIFCYRCGRRNVKVRDCPRCSPAWREEGPYIRRLHAHVPWNMPLPPREGLHELQQFSDRPQLEYYSREY